MEVTFLLTEYEDGTFRIETKHMHYHFRAFYDNLKAKDVVAAMREIANDLSNDGVAVLFEID